MDSKVSWRSLGGLPFAQEQLVTLILTLVLSGSIVPTKCVHPSANISVTSSSLDGDVADSRVATTRHNQTVQGILHSGLCDTCTGPNNTCENNSCVLDGQCYQEGATSPADDCLVCTASEGHLQWSTVEDRLCAAPWWKSSELSTWATCVPMIAGFFAGILAGFLMYKGYCRRLQGMPNRELVKVLILVISLSLAVASKSKPVKLVAFEVYYNSTTSDEACGRSYATTFLNSAVHSAEWLKSRCIDRGVNDSISIFFSPIATVKLYTQHAFHQVGITGTITISSTGAPKEELTKCKTIINETLQRPEQVAFVNETLVVEGNASLECSLAAMSPRSFFVSTDSWTCNNKNQALSLEAWECIDRVPTSGPARVTPIYDTNTSEDTVVDLPPSTTLRRDHVTPENVPSSSPPLDHAWDIELPHIQSPIRLVEGGPEVQLDIRIRVNRSQICQGSADCRITFNVSIAGGGWSYPFCRRTGETVPQVVFRRPFWEHVTNQQFCWLPLGVTLEPEVRTTLLLAAVSDNKYDGEQRRQLQLSLTAAVGSRVDSRTFRSIPIIIQDIDRKATCQSINDPHITTFDGLEYNNYHEGEFVLYSHTEKPAKVHVVYQRCSRSVRASCNCAVAVQSGDDVLVIDRCYRHKKVLQRISGAQRDVNPMSVQLYLNGQLTPGTRVYRDADGRKYYIYLPHGTYIKVMISGLLINVWVVAAPADMRLTKGLCGKYDTSPASDLLYPNGSRYDDQEEILQGSRGQPTDLLTQWRVEMDTAESLLQGVPRAKKPYEPHIYCQCEEGVKEPVCGRTAHVNNCDILQGIDVTELLVESAVNSPQYRRTRRDVTDNTISVISHPDPIIIDRDYTPPKKYKWRSDSHWNEATANTFCSQYIRDNYTIGKLCSEIPAVNFKQEIATCVEDIQITGNTSWASSARDAMKEQCLEEIQRNGSLPDDMASNITNSMCINDCSQNGHCIQSTCHCDAGYTSADCSVTSLSPPYADELPHYGLCDIRNMNCSRVIVYGENFVKSESLTCFFRECVVTEQSYIPKDTVLKRKAIFLNFNAVECVVPEVRSYLISVSNNGINKSDPLLFLPFDPQCNMCDAFNTTCTKIRNSCIIDNMCYVTGESSPNNECLVCRPIDDELQWTTLDDRKCQPPWWKSFKLPNWAVAVPAAIGGSIVGVLAGFLLYRCCCKNNKRRSCSSPTDINSHSNPDESPFEDAILHRNRGLPAFSSDRFADISLPRSSSNQADYSDNFFYNDGRGVDNGVDSTTYF